MMGGMGSVVRFLVVITIGLAGLALFWGCSSTPKYTKVYEGVPYIHVPLAANFTPYSNLTPPLSAAVRRRLSKVGVNVVGDCPGVLWLMLSVVDVNNLPGMIGMNRSARPDMDRILHLKVKASLQNARGETLAGPTVFENEERLLIAGTGEGDPRIYEQKKRSELYDEISEKVAQAFFSTP
jgi:hypothetical protein